MEQAAVILKKGEGRTLKAGGAWIFDNEIDKVEGTPEDGSLVEVRDFDGYGMGTGFYNSPLQDPGAHDEPQGRSAH